ncbi:MAG: hypothetical protein J0I10_18110 [Verrucomicrobia bacterium]|nr:hypothetical protein [Verrucomicrobiota bacterium]
MKAILVLLAVIFVASLPASEWTPVLWRGEKAWQSTSQGWIATVSEERSRLVSITRVGEGRNLLYESSREGISWGGHRGWLGPQSAWQPAWPPPRDWESSAALRVAVSGSLLTLTHPHVDPQYPALTRAYEWRGDVLHCRLSWRGGRFYGIHIVQLPRGAVVSVRRAVTPELPLGYALVPIYQRPNILIDVPLARAVSRVDGDSVTLRHANQSEKVAFFPQTIFARIGKYRLQMQRGDQSGFSSSEPDMGLLTQVYLGDRLNPFIEIEQLSPYVKGRAASTEMLLRPQVAR